MVKTYKVYYKTDYKNGNVPSIKLSGKWLQKLGFNSGDQFQLICNDGMLVLVKSDKQVEDLQTYIKIKNRQI